MVQFLEQRDELSWPEVVSATYDFSKWWLGKTEEGEEKGLLYGLGGTIITTIYIALPKNILRNLQLIWILILC
jgi:hypothetical protein